MAATTTSTNPRLSTLNPSKSTFTANNNTTTSLLSSSEQSFMLQGCRDNVRSDGRTRTELREYSLLQNAPLSLSNGSARILWNGGHVLCSCKAELVKPSPLRPNQGVVELHVDLLENQQRQQEESLQNTLSKLLFGSAVDLEKLCVVSGLYVWRLAVDVLILSGSEGGSVLDACSRVIRAALLNTQLPHVTPNTHDTTSTTKQRQQSSSGGGGAQVDLTVDGDLCHAVSVPGVDTCPIVVTVHLLKCPPKNAAAFIVDATFEEEWCASCHVRVAIDKSGQVCALLNQGPLEASLLSDILSTAVQASQRIFQQDEMVVVKEHDNVVGGGMQGETTTSLLQDQFQFR